MKKRQTQRDKTAFAYIRSAYGVPARFLARVWYQGRPGWITSGDGQYLLLTFEGETRENHGRFHPTYNLAYDRETPMAERPTDIGSLTRSALYWDAQHEARNSS